MGSVGDISDDAGTANSMGDGGSTYSRSRASVVVPCPIVDDAALPKGCGKCGHVD